MITVGDLTEINKQFSNGKAINNGSLEFAISLARDSKDWTKQLAYVVRAILIDHVFEEGNKRTAAALVISLFEIHKLGYDPQKVDIVIVDILKKNINNINKIRRMIKNATR